MKIVLKQSIFLLILSSFILIIAIAGCKRGENLNSKKEIGSFSKKRRQMLEGEIIARGITDKYVLRAMGKIPRHLFVPPEFRQYAYRDYPLPIGFGQTISQPYIVALMSEKISLHSTDKVLEIGTGSGYQAAVLAEIVKEVYTIELIPELSHRAEALLKKLGYKNVHFKIGDGWKGWTEFSPFDAVLVTAAADKLPQNLIKQLKVGGKMIVPIGPPEGIQYLTLVIKKANGNIYTKRLIPVRFVPFVHTDTYQIRNF